MRLDRFITLNLVRPLHCLRNRLPPSALGPRPSALPLPILMYHSISDASEEDVSPYYRTCTSPAMFRQQMAQLQSLGYAGIDLETGLAWLRNHPSPPAPSPHQVPLAHPMGEGGRRPGEGNRAQESTRRAPAPSPSLPLRSGERAGVKCPDSAPSSQPSALGSWTQDSSDHSSHSDVECLGLAVPQSAPPTARPAIGNRQSAIENRRPVVVTFDDGFRNFYTHAFPALQEYGFTATMFLPTAFIQDQRHSFNWNECLTWDEVREMQHHGIRFGSHTCTHPKLVDLSWKEIELETRKSKLEIETRLGCSVTAFAYPFAFPQADQQFARTFSHLLAETGYDCCATTELGRVKPGDDTYRLKRLPVNSLDDSKLFRAKLEGSYDWLAFPQAMLKRVKSWGPVSTSRSDDCLQ